MRIGPNLRRVIRLVLIVLYGTPLFGQHDTMTIGAKVGAQFNSSFEVRDLKGTETNYLRPVVGLAFELPMTHSISVEANALYNQEQYRTHFSAGGRCSVGGCSTPSLVWETHGYSLGFPVVLKLKKDLDTNGQIRYFGEIGMSARHSSITSSCSYSSPLVLSACPSSYSETRGNFGLVFGGGVDFRKGRFHFSPEFRYTRWMNDDEIWGPTSELRIKVNEFKVLFGVSVGKK